MSAVRINFTNGVGNNMFQYIYARLVAEAQGKELCNPALPALGIAESKVPLNIKCTRIEGSSKKPFDYHSLLHWKHHGDLDLKVYPEDFTLYMEKLPLIKSWFALPGDWGIGSNDLVMHLRLGDRLIMKSTYAEDNYVAPEEFVEAIESFNFDRLHIVSDMPVWRKISAEEVKGMMFHRKVKEGDLADSEVSATYFNALYDALSKYDPIVRAGNFVEDDFRYMMAANKLMLQHGTLAWWAGVLGEAEEVAVYGRWRGKKKGNLGWTDLPGWRQWGRKTAPPHNLKQRHLLRLAKSRKLTRFVETGTRGGAMLKALYKEFSQLDSVEIIPEAFRKLSSKLKNYTNVKLFLGDSAERLPEMLSRLNGAPALFWLDAHDGRNSTPILAELKHIFTLTTAKHTIVIDDMRYFGSEKAYPSIDMIKDITLHYRPDALIDIQCDAIRIFL